MVSFKEHVKESLFSKNGEKLDAEIIEFIALSFNIRTQTHIFHLITKSYAEHIAIEEFYEKLLEYVDSFAEISLGLGLDSVVLEKEIPSKISFKYSTAKLITLLKNYRAKTDGLIVKSNEGHLMSINDLLIDIQTIIDTLIYKLQLK